MAAEKKYDDEGNEIDDNGKIIIINPEGLLKDVHERNKKMKEMMEELDNPTRKKKKKKKKPSSYLDMFSSKEHSLA